MTMFSARMSQSYATVLESDLIHRTTPSTVATGNVSHSEQNLLQEVIDIQSLVDSTLAFMGIT